MSAALLDWCRDLHPVKLQAPRGTLRRRVELPSAGGALWIELAADLDARRAHLALPLERLPSYVAARITTAARSLDKHEPARREARARAGPLLLASESLDLPAAQALVDALARGPFQLIEALEITLSPERCEVLAVAPSTREEWSTLVDGVLALVGWLTRRWPPSYRM